MIDTTDFEPEHGDIARKHFAEFGFADRITVHCGNADKVLPSPAEGKYDLAFFDGFAPTQGTLGAIHRLLRPGGTFVCANLTQGTAGNVALSVRTVWICHSFGETALAVKR